MHKIFWAAIILAHCLACGGVPQQNKESHAILSEEAFIGINGFELLDTNRRLYIEKSDKPIIRLFCATNFPDGTVVEIYKDADVETSSNIEGFGLSESETALVIGNELSFTFPPSMIYGYVIFHVHAKNQPDNVLQIIGTNGENIMASEEHVWLSDAYIAHHQAEEFKCVYVNLIKVEYSINKQYMDSISISKASTFYIDFN